MKTKKVNAAVFYGTSAELIKLWPVILGLSERTSVSLLTSNQQPHELRELEGRFNLTGIRHLRSADKGNLVNRIQVVPWLVTVLVQSVRQLRTLRRSSKKQNRNVLVFVHGDTMTSVLGAVAGRLARCEVVHVEAGLRSHDWRNPFPEEIDRILTAYLAKYHFAPDQTAVENLADIKGMVINTQGNTARDSMMLMNDVQKELENQSPFTLVSLHRAELLGNEEVFIRTINELVEVSENNRLIMVLDALTRSTLERLDLMILLQNSEIELHEKMAYPDFLKFVMAADRVVTDSGGLQEECAFLKIPCLVHRKATERFDGIGDSAKLSYWDEGAIKEFISAPLKFSENGQCRQLDNTTSPTEIIIQTLHNNGLL